MRYALILNDMRASNIENIEIVAVNPSREELVSWCQGQLADAPYMDGRWGKIFKVGSPLEWYNAPHSFETTNDYWGGIWEVPDEVGVGTALYKG